MSTPSHSDRLATGETTAADGGSDQVEHPGRSHSGGSVLARIPDVRPEQEDKDDSQTHGKRRIRVDSADPTTGATKALLRQDHSSWHISRRLLAVVGSLVAALAVAAYFQMRKDSAAPASQVDPPATADSFDTVVGWQAERRTNDLHPHDHGDASQRAPDYFSKRPSSSGDTRWTDRRGAGQADVAQNQPDYGTGSTHREPAGPGTPGDFKSNRDESSAADDGRPAVTDSRVFARLGTEYDQNTPRYDPPAPSQQQSIFPWRRSGQRLSWQQPGLQQPGGRTSAFTDPRTSRFEGRFSGSGQFDRHSSNTPKQQPYPDTGAAGH
ncbi:MAG: hypothetical protein IIA67_05360, partial [Planctomycetes bacterium]|nr:hypothetical protein [Planctomycetota bacterium]